jgi:hypothetical protein
MLTTVLIILFAVLGLPFGVWMVWAALTYDNHPEFWSDK